MILTRYLYDKTKVETSLQSAIMKQDYDQALFWAYELFYSGFQAEVIDQSQKIYEKFFSKNHPRMGRYIKLKKIQLQQNPELLATIIKNLTMKNPTIQENPTAKFVNVKPHHIVPFMTKEPDTKTPVWRFLHEVCKYGVEGKSSVDELKEYRNEWLRNSSPIWKDRLAVFGGKIIEGVVVFEHEDKEEEFYNRFGYEPDEQPLEIQKKCIGV